MSQKIYILKSDSSGTTFSIPTPIGVAVTTKEEAEKFVKKAEKDGWWQPCYEEVEVFTNMNEALKSIRCN